MNPEVPLSVPASLSRHIGSENLRPIPFEGRSGLARWTALSGAALGSIFGSSSLFAQEAPSETTNDGDDPAFELPDLEVKAGSRLLSSPRFTQPLRDIAQSVEVIPSVVIEQQGASSLRDVLRNTPGITFQAGEGGGAPGDNLYIRGFSARTDIFVDGVRDSGDFSRDSFNVEQVEVVKGPSSSHTGRGSTGGTVNLVTKKPLEAKFTQINAEVGTADHLRASLDFNQPLNGEGTMGVRLNLMAQDSGVAGRDEVESKSLGVAPAFTFPLGPSTRVTANYQHLEQNNLPDYGLWRDATTDPNYDWSAFYGLTERDFEDIESDSAALEIHHEMSEDFTLRNLTRASRNTRQAGVTSPRLSRTDPETMARRDDFKTQDRENSIVANQTDLQLSLGSEEARHDIVVGLELSREIYKNFGVTVTGDAPETDLYHPTPNDPWNGTIARSGAVSKGTGDTTALFLGENFSLGRHWEFGGSVRREEFDASVEDRAVDGGTTEFSRKDAMTSWRGSVVYKPFEQASVYASIGTSFNPSAEALTLSESSRRGTSTTNNPNLEPQKNKSYEVGAKWDALEGRLFLSTALFRTVKSHSYETDANDNLVPAGDRTVEGIELSIAGYLTPEWYVYGGFSYMESSVESGIGAEEVELAYTPGKSFNLWTTYAILDGFTLGAGAQYTGDYYYSNSNDPSGIPDQASYWLLNAMIAYSFSERFTLRLNVDNLADERYIERGYSAHFTPGPSRSATLTAELRF